MVRARYRPVIQSAIRFCMALLLVTGCSGKKDKLPRSAEGVQTPYQEITNSILYFYSGSEKKWKLESAYMRKMLNNQGSILVTPVLLTLYDTTGATNTHILSDSGETNNNMNSFTVWGDVYIETDDKQVIQTQRLVWNKNSRKVTSDTYVQITTPNGDVLRGKGLIANERFTQWSLKENVTGTFPNFKRRVERGEQQ